MARIAMASKAALVAPGLPMARVPTGIPPGIWTVESSESMPLRDALSMGTPRTGKIVWAAATPAKCAAPPAAAMMTLTPRDSAPEINSAVACGSAVRGEHSFLVGDAELSENVDSSAS